MDGVVSGVELLGREESTPDVPMSKSDAQEALFRKQLSQVSYNIVPHGGHKYYVPITSS